MWDAKICLVNRNTSPIKVGHLRFKTKEVNLSRRIRA